MTQRLMTLVLILFSNSVLADWTEFSNSSKNGDIKTYYNIADARNKNQIVKIWQIQDYAVAQTIDNKSVRSTKSLLEINCKTKMIRTLASNSYQQNWVRGESVLKNSMPTEWKYIAPDVTTASARNLYCGKAE